jgi:hypothetical protein
MPRNVTFDGKLTAGLFSIKDSRYLRLLAVLFFLFPQNSPFKNRLPSQHSLGNTQHEWFSFHFSYHVPLSKLGSSLKGTVTSSGLVALMARNSISKWDRRFLFTFDFAVVKVVNVFA